MPRATTLLAGLLAATAITYQSRINLVTNTANVQKQIDEAKLKADQLTTKPTDRITRLSLSRPTSSVEKFIDNSKHYYKGRLVPSGKKKKKKKKKCAFCIRPSDVYTFYR
jgi:hypothetical protein